MDRRRKRVLALLQRIAKAGVVKKDKILADFAIGQGLDQRKVEGYCSQLAMSESIDERVVEGITMIGTQDAWEEFERQAKARQEIRR